jgi:hypothetical protein
MLQQLPEPLNSLLTAVHFKQAARTYNSSTGIQYAAVCCVRMHGRAYHRIGTILHLPDSQSDRAAVRARHRPGVHRVGAQRSF